MIEQKKIIICADDFALTENISTAIIQLAEKKRLSAISCLTTAADWSEHAKDLKHLTDKVDLGLHFNLTEGVPLTNLNGKKFFSLKQLIFTSYFKRLDHEAIRAELMAQLDQFRQHLNQDPDFIDGHQHIHQLPQIREVLLDVYEQCFPKHQVYLRHCWQQGFYNVATYLKEKIIYTLGTKKFHQSLHRYSPHLPHNTNFAGIYPFSEKIHYPRICEFFLKKLIHGGLMMCHPALPTDLNIDPINAHRVKEYNFLMSDEFGKVGEELGIKIGRYGEIFSNV